MKSFVFGGECGRRYVGAAWRFERRARRGGCGRWRNVFSRMARHPATGVNRWLLVFERPYQRRRHGGKRTGRREAPRSGAGKT